jgi:hypothetical protein
MVKMFLGKSAWKGARFDLIRDSHTIFVGRKLFLQHAQEKSLKEI